MLISVYKLRHEVDGLNKKESGNADLKKAFHGIYYNAGSPQLIYNDIIGDVFQMG